MRNLKKILAMALTVLMVVGSFAMTATAAFDDVTDYQEAIDVMYELGIAKGISDTEFAPDESVTREQMALWIAKIMTGKVDDTYVTNNFLGAVENLTAFADLEEENYVGAINYAANNGIIVGTSATTFEATEAIKIQDVFAMVVRMLGYGSTAMNNNYPWSFIDKAISLGLDADLPADYSNEAEATRGETMQILFNALTALKSDGSTLGYDFFGLEKATVVITGTADGNMYSGAELIKKTVDDEDYVSFAVLSANGVVSADTATYYILKSAFGIDKEADAEWYVGDSFVVRTVDGFASFLTCEANPYEIVDQDYITGVEKHLEKDCLTKDAHRYVDLNGDSYKLVEAYSNFNGATKTNNDYEIILTKANGKRDNTFDLNSYVMDANLNILAADGKGPNGDGILLNWVTTFGVGKEPAYANLNGMYLYKLSDGTYIQPNDYIWSLAKKASVTPSSSYGFSVLACSYDDIEEYDAYSDTVLYDDDNDGDWDRGIYYQYKFDFVKDNSSKKYDSTDAKGTLTADVTIYDTEGNLLTFADIDEKYVLYHYNPLYKTMLIKEIFVGQTGLVTGIDLVNKVITFNQFGANIVNGIVSGETYTIGNEKLLGATFDNIRALDSNYKALTNIIGKNVSFIEKDGNVLAIYKAVDNANYMVYVNKAPGYTTMGYNTILAYYDPAANKAATTQAAVVVNAVNNYWYSNSMMVNGMVDSNYVGLNDFETGDLLKATKDTLGNYDVAYVARDSYTWAKELNEANDSNLEIIVNNGIATFANNDADDAQIAPVKVNASTVWILYDESNDYTLGFKTYAGAPNGWVIEATDKVFVQSSSGTASFIYVYGADVEAGSFNVDNNPFNTKADSTIIYADANTVSRMNYSNQYTWGTGTLVGGTYTYTNAIDVIKGGFAPAYQSDANFQAKLIPGKFYRVVNGYVVGEYDDMKTGILLNADAQGAGNGFDTTYDTTYNYASDEAVDEKVMGPKYFNYELIRDVDEEDFTKKYNAGTFEYSYVYGADDTDTYTQRYSPANSVMPILYTLNGSVGFGSDVYCNEPDYQSVLVDVLNKSQRTNANYKAVAQPLYDAMNDLYDVVKVDTTAKSAVRDTTAIDTKGVVVYYFDDPSFKATMLDSAPVFIAKSNTVITVEAFDTEAAADEALAEAWEAKLATVNAPVHIFAWDNTVGTNSSTITNAEDLLTGVTVAVNGKNATFTKQQNDSMMGALNAGTSGANGATITLTGKAVDFKTSDGKALVNSYKIFLTSDNGVYTFETLGDDNVKTETYYEGAFEMTKVTITLDNSMIVNIDTDKEVTNSANVAALANGTARILVLIHCK